MHKIRLLLSSALHPTQGKSSSPHVVSPAQNSRYRLGLCQLQRIQAWCPFPTFPRSSRKHQRAHWGPAHSEQVLVGQLQGGQGLGLQHGVQVDVAVGPSAQEEIPRQDAGQTARQGMNAGDSGVAGGFLPDSSWAVRLMRGLPRPPNLGSSSKVRGRLPGANPRSSGYWGSNGEDPGPGQTAGPLSSAMCGLVGLPHPPCARGPVADGGGSGPPYLWKGEQLTE